jgi:hypothetical protein
MSFELTALVLSWIAIALLAFAMAGILRQVRVLSQAVALPRSLGPQGATLPDELANGDAASRKPHVVLFLTRDCDVCEARRSELESLAERQNEELAFTVVYPDAGNGAGSGRVRALTHQGAVFQELAIPVTPFGVVAKPGGSIAFGEPVGSASALRELTQKAREL